jgi:hypothetical protein
VHGSSLVVDSPGSSTGVLEGECVRLLDTSGQSMGVCGCRVAECALGNLVADAARWIGSADVGFINSGALRKPLPAGAVAMQDVMQAVSKPWLKPGTSGVWF